MIYAQVLIQEHLMENCGNFSKTLAMSNHKQKQCNTILSEDGNLAVNDEQAADLLDLYYQNISRLNFSVEDRNIKIRASRIVLGCRSNTHRGTSIFSRDFRMNELDAAFGDSCLNKSPGPDDIHGQRIDHLGLSARQRFLDIINCSWNKRQLRRDWRRAIIIPIKKWGKTDGTPESYRPIALTSIACKIMENMVLRRLTFHLHSHNLLLEEQYGFREGHCTTDQLLYFCQRIRDAHNRKPTNRTVEVFLDLSKAFDRVWNNFLVIKLYKMFGVPQGSVLSLTLFSFYLPGIDSALKRKCEVGAFADDIVLWKSDSDLTKLEIDINLVLEDIQNFALDHKLTFNSTKSMVQLSASRIITGLKNTCTRDIVLFEADLQPLSLRRRACLTKYYNKLRSLDSRNRISAYFKDWCNNQRLRRNSPFSQMVSFKLTIGAVDAHHVSQCLDPADNLDGVFFHPELLIYVYTDGSRDDYRCGSGIYIKSQDQRRNPDGCSVFRSELIAIDEAFGFLASSN
ncbi:probable RNA-directed DNA polymerase from transposon BS [Trichonephila clavipes]|nr:probable RNA-directed DNA polymerase from transposon BS [Trichonephila clavipes]